MFKFDKRILNLRIINKRIIEFRVKVYLKSKIRF